MKTSNCCNAPVIEESDICSQCKEHCEAIENKINQKIKEIILNKLKNYTDGSNRRLYAEDYFKISEIIYRDIKESKRFKYLALRDTLYLDFTLSVYRSTNERTFEERVIEKIESLL